ncbi:ATP-dependent helicase [Luteibaculum oceani]|uniref:DNA 3'-5' helicase n=1 Tax=Luteibaculum oceani TaxID=1294296 RepID=A0A5C6V1W8_9FLAO|nr:UvrD-helicase domain-containing protein [Luteibaculum oceani]TXC78406.1 AAA family ATPase [Luteibaculum oceani]
MQSDILTGLNPAQRQAVEQTNGALMVIAGAGSGKTRVLTYRIAYLIQQGIDPFNILALTFTNKAAKEMKERIALIVGQENARNIWMGTFHSVFAKILRFEAEKINYPSNFTIYDSADSKSLLNTIIKELQLDDKVYKVSIVQSRISGAKNNLISPKQYLENVDIQADDRAAGRPKLGAIYQEYWQRCFKAGAMDFDDLLFKTNILLRDFPETLLKYQDRFRYILVDEYQDTNHAQYLIVKKLAARFQNLCVVGDDAQSIYAFRGANIQNILNFRKDYPDYSLIKLEQNYRSTQTIVNAANSVISNNRDQIKKEVWTENDQGDRIKIFKANSDNEEGMFVAQSIFELQHQHHSTFNDFAILYRTNAQSRALEEALRKINIPYKIYGGLSFYQRKEIKDLLAYFRLTSNPNDEEAFKRIINYPARGIGKTTMDKLTLAANENDTSLWEVANSPGQYNCNINAGTRAKIESFTTMIKSLRSELHKEDAYLMAEKIAKSSGLLKELYNDKTPEGVARYENVQELLNGIKEFAETQKEQDAEAAPKLEDFLLDVALLTDADQDNEDEERVSLMTIHASKGLEFPYIFIVGMEENLFPSQMSVNSRSDLEEERRLFYVAITRAKQKATLSYATSRFRWGNLIYSEPSRFLDELDDKYVDWPVQMQRTQVTEKRTGGAIFTKKINPPKPKNLKKIPRPSAGNPDQRDYANVEDIRIGIQVEHGTFGKGKVVAIDGVEPNLKATVYFPAVGQKQLLLRFAKLRVIG